MPADATATLDADILLEALTRGEEVNPEMARWLLDLRFTERQKSRMLELADRNNEGTLLPAEREEMFRYAHIGTTLSILHSKARLALRREVQSA
jgi:hypothetical protein